MKFLFNMFLFMCASLLCSEEGLSSWHQSDAKTRTERWQLTPDKEIEWVFDLSGNRTQWTDWTGKTIYT